MDLQLRDKAYLVTGGGRGLGFAAAEALVAEGARVLISGPHEASVKAATATLGRRAGAAGRVAWVVADNTDPATPELLIATAAERFDLSFSDGAISGTPTQGGTYPIILTATNGVGLPATQDFTLTVDAPPLITSAITATFQQGEADSFAVTASGTPAPTITEFGNLPPGLTYSDGVLSGTPQRQGTYELTFMASNDIGVPSFQEFTLTVAGLTITTDALPPAKIGSPYDFDLAAAGGQPPLRWKRTSGKLPSGLKLSSRGAISGTPKKRAGTSTFQVTVKDSSRSNRQSTSTSYTLNVSP